MSSGSDSPCTSCVVAEGNHAGRIALYNVDQYKCRVCHCNVLLLATTGKPLLDRLGLIAIRQRLIETSTGSLSYFLSSERVTKRVLQ
jgi:hypothetical protein